MVVPWDVVGLGMEPTGPHRGVSPGPGQEGWREWALALWRQKSSPGSQWDEGREWGTKAPASTQSRESKRTLEGKPSDARVLVHGVEE